MYPDNSENKSIPSGSFLTCSSDDTIRVWNLDFTESEENNSLYRRNIYSNVSNYIFQYALCPV